MGCRTEPRRAAVSIPANIAESFGKRSPAEKARFLEYCGRLPRRVPLLSTSLPRHLGYGQTDSLMGTLEEASRRKRVCAGDSGFRP